MNINKNCCYKCKERVLGCHANCKKYAEYQKELKRYNEEKKKTRNGVGNWFECGSRFK